MTAVDHPFGPDDDDLHTPSADFYDTETFWFSFFVPEQALGAWLYTTVRQTAGVSGGGAWIWDATGVDPWEIRFFEQFSWLKVPAQHSPARLAFPNGAVITRRQPLMSYDLTYEDRDRLSVALRFDALEAPVPLLSGAPPYPKATHFDQTGRVTGRFVLDGARTEVDCFAMRDRSWGPRAERGYRRVGYCWAADADTTFLSFSTPAGDDDDPDADRIYAGYLRRDGDVAHLVSGRRRTVRHPVDNWVTAIELEAVDTLGRRVVADARATSRMILPGATSMCINTVLAWTVDGRAVHGEDQDVWPIKEWRRSRAG